MQITVNIPDEFVSQVLTHGNDPAQSALELIAIDGYRCHSLTESQVGRMLGYSTRMEVWALFADRRVERNFSDDDLQQDFAASDALVGELSARSR